MATVLFVPGFKENFRSRDYQRTMQAIVAKGYEVKFVPINWWRTTITDWLTELEKVYEGYNPDETILAGFSFGAVVALSEAAKRLPSELWLFSLSPVFNDDPELTKPEKSTLRNIGKRRLRAFATQDYKNIVNRVSCKTILFYGEDEGMKFPDLKRRCAQAARDLPNTTLTKIPNVGHAVDNPVYVEAIQACI